MRITKYGHSCLLLEENGYRILFDPGAFTFAEHIVQPTDIPKPLAILITHEHPDHFLPDAIRVIEDGGPIPIITNAELAPKAAGMGFTAEALAPDDIKTIGPFTIRGVAGAHGDLPVPKPDNIGFVVNDVIYHPGDSLLGNIPYGSVPVLALPFMAPWGTTKLAYEYAVAVKPKIVIPIHDGYVKSFFLDRLYEQGKAVLEPHGISFTPLAPGSSIDV